MVSRPRVWLMAVALAMVAAVSVRAGGWSVITVDELPEFVRAGEPFTITYAVRQHGVSLLPDLRGRIDARSEDDAVVSASVVPLQPGYYKATLTLSRAGRWALTVRSGFEESLTGRSPGVDSRADRPVMRMVAVPAARSRPAPQPPPERGLHLYVAKGCVACHAHARSDVRSFGIGPDLTDVRHGPGYLRTILTHGVRGPDQTSSIRMPDLGLRPPEIEALVAFLQTGGQTRVSTAR
jgi:mono/diheme cytochrome c family protein